MELGFSGNTTEPSQILWPMSRQTQSPSSTMPRSGTRDRPDYSRAMLGARADPGTVSPPVSQVMKCHKKSWISLGMHKE